MKLSFVVPIYNVKDYLQKCVDSLVAQNYDDYEIILVDDGSTDGSGELADSIKDDLVTNKGDKYISVIHQKNKGLSGARNSGIKVAKGDYICFVDSDDYWNENVLSSLMTQIERDNLDVLRFRWQNVNSAYEIFNPYKETNFADFSAEPLSGRDYLNQRMGIQCYVWSFIVRNEICQMEFFTEGILFEDTDWTPRMLERSKIAAGTETVVYNYLWREDGITLSKSPDKLRRELDNKIALVGKLKQWGSTDWYKGMISALVLSLINILGQQLYDNREDYINKIMALDVFPISTYCINKKARRKIHIINFSPRLAIWLLHLKNR